MALLEDSVFESLTLLVGKNPTISQQELSDCSAGFVVDFAYEIVTTENTE